MDTKETFTRLIAKIEEVSEHARVYFDSDDFSNEQKSDGSVVTKIDNDIECALREFITEHFPADGIVGEEEDSVAGTSGYVWHIDPIDGTDNFLRKIPFCAVSVARLGDTAEGSFAVVHNPITNHTFSTVGAGGTLENGHPVHPTAEPMGGRYFISIDRGRESWMYPAANKLQVSMAGEFGKVTSLGCAALNLAYVAAGRFDGVLTFGLNTYDYAAGLSLIAAGGGAISVHDGTQWRRFSGSLKELCDEHGKTILASHPDVHQRLCEFIGDPRAWADRTLE